MPSVRNSLHLQDWLMLAEQHSIRLQSMIYPPGKDLKRRQFAILQHPVYNFLSKYYRYAPTELMKFSPGLNVLLCNATEKEHAHHLVPQLLVWGQDGCKYDASMTVAVPPFSRYGKVKLTANRDILAATAGRKPFLGCFGFHEWAMLYSGSKTKQPLADSSVVASQSSERHQERLPLRVSQEEIDGVVDSNPLRCTHFDAWRFFHKDAKGLNAVHPLSRATQTAHEQPGCVHASMDTFRYAYELYPLVSSDLLLRALELAIAARRLDMRASPYDVSAFEGCEGPIRVETPEGRRQYVSAQERLAQQAAPVRGELLTVYNEVLEVIEKGSATAGQ